MKRVRADPPRSIGRLPAGVCKATCREREMGTHFPKAFLLGCSLLCAFALPKDGDFNGKNLCRGSVWIFLSKQASFGSPASFSQMLASFQSDFSRLSWKLRPDLLGKSQSENSSCLLAAILRFDFQDFCTWMQHRGSSTRAPKKLNIKNEHFSNVCFALEIFEQSDCQVILAVRSSKQLGETKLKDQMDKQHASLPIWHFARG